MNEWTVYILESETTGQFYVGLTSDLTRRVEYHSRGLSRWTRGRGPWRVVYTEVFQTRGEAARRERELKGWKSRRSLEELIRSKGEH